MYARLFRKIVYDSNPLRDCGIGRFRLYSHVRLEHMNYTMFELLKDLTPQRPATDLGYETPGVVYTKPWVIEIILELASYTEDKNLVDAFAVEPAAGDGAFVLAMVTRLVASCRKLQRPLRDCADSLLAYELDEKSSARMRTAIL